MLIFSSSMFCLLLYLFDEIEYVNTEEKFHTRIIGGQSAYHGKTVDTRKHFLSTALLIVRFKRKKFQKIPPVILNVSLYY